LLYKAYPRSVGKKTLFQRQRCQKGRRVVKAPTLGADPWLDLYAFTLFAVVLCTFLYIYFYFYSASPHPLLHLSRAPQMQAMNQMPDPSADVGIN